MNENIAVLKELMDNDNFLKYLGGKVEKIEPGYCKIVLGFKDNLTRYGNIINGGVIATLADSAGGCAVLTVNDGRDQVTVNLNISYLSAIKSGPVSAEANIIRSGKNVAFAEISIYDGSGKKCATATGTWFFRNIEI
ncbi:MAG: PaaI family thioesterase [Thermoplasmata archaeon]